MASPDFTAPGLFVAFPGFSSNSLVPTEPLGRTASAVGSMPSSPLVFERGQEKSSARPRGATVASPRLSTRAASGSASRSAGCFAAPTSSPLFSVPVAFKGRTGPTASLAGDCFSGPGKATGTAWLAQHPAQIVLDIVPKLLRTGLGKIHPVISAQAARLPFEIRPVLDIVPLIVERGPPLLFAR